MSNKTQLEKNFKYFWKNLKKGVDKREEMLYNSTCAAEVSGSQEWEKQTSERRIGPWKLNNEYRKKPVMTLRKTQRITVRCTLKIHQEIHGYVRYSEWAIKLWNWFERASVEIQILESLILAQDERWRRA